MLLSSTALLLLIALFAVESVAVGEDNPILVHVIFRHGDRQHNAMTVGLKSQLGKVTYFPTGCGQLTKIGKLREYNIGRSLRRRYDKLLGEVFTPDVVDSRLTDVNRTKASLDLLLAGAFPPKKGQIWNDDLFWQPIPHSYLPSNQDNFLVFSRDLPVFTEAFKAYMQSPGPQKVFRNFRSTLNDLSDLTGWNITTFSLAADLYLALTSEKEVGLSLPEWTEKYYPEVLEAMTIQNYVHMTGTLQLKQLAMGSLLKKIVDDSMSKIRGHLPEDRKLYLYSGNELDVASLLGTLGFFDHQVPRYGAQVIFELHEIEGIHGIKLLHDANRGGGPQLLTLAGCNSFCPIGRFASLVGKYFPPTEA